MRNISLVAAICVNARWRRSLGNLDTQARIDVPTAAQVNPLQITMGAKHLPVAHYDDYSLEFN